MSGTLPQPSAVTAPVGTNNTQVATTAFVEAAIVNAVGGWSPSNPPPTTPGGVGSERVWSNGGLLMWG